MASRVCVRLLALLCLLAPRARAAPVHKQVWEDATPATIADARACLTGVPVYLGMYYPQILNAFQTNLTVLDEIQCEALLLGTMYSRLSASLSACTALAHGIRACAHYLESYAGPAPTGNPFLLPAQFPVRTLTELVNECETRVAALGAHDLVTATTYFRRRFSPGTNCLRAHTRQALVASKLFPGPTV
jgi:hypothetical protein